MPCRTPAPSPRQSPPSIAAAGSYRHQAAPPEVPDFTGGVAAREDRVPRDERVRPRPMGGHDGMRRDPAIHFEERAGAVRGEQLARPADLVVRSGEVRLPAEPGVHGHDEQQVKVGDDLFRELQWRPGVQREPGEHALTSHRSEQALHVYRRLRMKREDGGTGGRERLEVALGLDYHQVHVDRLVGESAQRRDHVRPEREVRHETPVHHVHVQPVGASRQHLRHLLGEPAQVRRQDAGRDANPPPRGHHGLRATTMSTTVPGAARVPAAGFCPTTVPGFASLVRRRVTVPSSRPSSSSRVRASACDIPSRSGTAIVGAPRLTTTVTGAPGLSTEVAAGRVSIATPGGAAACTDSTCATVSPAAAIRRRASSPFNPATSGTGILGGPSLDTRATLSPAGALTPGGGSCHTIVPWGAVGCGSLPPSWTWRPAFRSWSDASWSDTPNTRGTTPCPCNIGPGNKIKYAVR